VAALLADIVNPILRPVRRIVPPIGGLDLSALLVLLLIQAILIALPVPF
jgi:YggT family protein